MDCGEGGDSAVGEGVGEWTETDHYEEFESVVF